jgi:hypothetical protein
LTDVQVLKLANFSKAEANSRNKQTLLSNRRRGVDTAEDKKNTHHMVEGLRARHILQQVTMKTLESIDFQSVSSVSGITYNECTAE